MHFVDTRRNALERHDEERPTAPLHPGSAALRRAFRQHIVSFPSQVPPLLKAPAGDMQWRVVLLYFVRGWSAPKVAVRFGAPVHRIRKILNAWSLRALELGYIQVVDPEAFAICCRAGEAGNAAYFSSRGDSAPVVGRAIMPAAGDPAGLTRSKAGPQPEKAAPQSQTWHQQGALGEAGPIHQDIPRRLSGVTAPFHAAPDGANLLAALDAAIGHCEELRGAFWVHTVTLLRDLRTVAAGAFAIRLSSEQAVRPFDEERVSHVV